MQSFSFDSDLKRWTCDVQGQQCSAIDRPASVANSELSPDGKLAAFIRDHNLWVRDVKTGQDTQLTTDGVKDYGYATDNAGWTMSDRPVLKWSPDSKRIATFQQDQRKAGEMYLVNTVAGHPTLKAWKYPLPGDEQITMIERVIIDVEPVKVTRLKMGQDQHRSTLCDDVQVRRRMGGRAVEPGQQPGRRSSRPLATISRPTCESPTPAAARSARCSRKRARPSSSPAMAASTGAALPGSNEAIWFSQRDNWGQLYLHDLQTGKQKSQLTSGDGNVTQLLRVDEAGRMLYYQGVGKERGRDPYFRHFYRQAMDGKPAQLLTPGRCRPRDLAGAVRETTSSTTSPGPTRRPPPCCATTPARWCCSSRRWTSAG